MQFTLEYPGVRTEILPDDPDPWTWKQLFLQYLRVRSEKSKMNLILELKKHFAYHDEKFPDLKEIFPGVLWSINWVFLFELNFKLGEAFVFGLPRGVN